MTAKAQREALPPLRGSGGHWGKVECADVPRPGHTGKASAEERAHLGWLPDGQPCGWIPSVAMILGRALRDCWAFKGFQSLSRRPSWAWGAWGVASYPSPQNLRAAEDEAEAQRWDETGPMPRTRVFLSVAPR